MPELLATNDSEGLFTHWKKGTRFFSEQKYLYGFLMDFSWKQKDFCQRCTRFLEVKCPSNDSTFNLAIIARSGGLARLPFEINKVQFA